MNTGTETPMTTPANDIINGNVPAEPAAETVKPFELASAMLEAAGFEEFQSMRDDQHRFCRIGSSMKAVINKKMPTKVFFFDSTSPTDKKLRLLWDIFDDQSMFGRIIRMWQEENGDTPEEELVQAELVEEESAEDGAQYEETNVKTYNLRPDPRDFICVCCEEACICPDRPREAAYECSGNCEADDNGLCTCIEEGWLDDNGQPFDEDVDFDSQCGTCSTFEFLPEQALQSLAEVLIYSGMGVGEGLEEIGMFPRLYNHQVIRQRLEEHGLIECGTCGWWYLVDEINADDECACCESDTNEAEKELEQDEQEERQRIRVNL